MPAGESHAAVRDSDETGVDQHMAGYVEANLIRGESVMYEAKPHWILFVSLRSVFTLGLLPLIEYWTSEFAVTNRRVIMKVGWVARRVLELNLHKIESVNVDQSLLGRLLGYGTITVIGTGGTRETFDRIAHPLVFRKAFQQQESEVEAMLDRGASTTSGAGTVLP
jgi:uncharacterized membrane protein YdbT with pleckstrin-like domain